MAAAVQEAYSRGQVDYSMEPLVRVDVRGEPVGLIKDGDGVIVFCRRGEREIELTEAFTEDGFSHFQRVPLNLSDFVILTLYHDKFLHLPVAFAPDAVSNTLGELVSQAGMKQFRCSESEKFAHITVFLNGGRNEPFPGETRKRFPSPKGVAFDQVPGLSLAEVADELIRRVSGPYRLIVTNFANGDVIGHTSNDAAKIECAEIVDHHLNRVVTAALAEELVVIITADHGNLELMRTDAGKAHVAHTSNLVPLIVLDKNSDTELIPEDGRLSDLAPTILAMLDLDPAAEMTGKNLLPGHVWGADRRVLLIILDGWGLGREDETNPIHLADTPFWDALISQHPYSRLSASGEAVGLQAGKPGNSEAGHSNIGAGRVVLQDDTRLDLALRDGSFSSNPVFLKAMQKVKARGSALHLIGLLSEKSSHGSIDYPLALIKMAKEQQLNEVYLHLIFDGRSTEPGSAPVLLKKLDEELRKIGLGQIVTGVGRGLALDRDGNYGKVQLAYEAMVDGIGTVYA